MRVENPDEKNEWYIRVEFLVPQIKNPRYLQTIIIESGSTVAYHFHHE